MTLFDEVRAHAAEVAASARHVTIDLDRVEAIERGPEPALDPVRHFLEGTREEVAAYVLTLTAINFGSGWFPDLRKRVAEGRPVSGYFTVAWGLTDYFRAHGPLTNEQLRGIRATDIAQILAQRPDHELMGLFAQALRQLGAFLGERRPIDVVDAAGGSAERLARTLIHGMAMFNDVGFYKRAQIVSSDLALAGVADFSDLDALTIFADNLVPHVLRCDGVLRYDEALAARIDSELTLNDAGAEREIRACAVHACAQIAPRLGVPERVLDMWLWSRGQDPRYKARPRHRARSIFY